MRWVRRATDLEADSESFRNWWESGTLIFMMLMINMIFWFYRKGGEVQMGI
jgi:cbb3-type cytochrome oxidase subunit 3